MDSATFDETYAWLVAKAMNGLNEVDLIQSFCERCRAGGLPISRMLMFVDTLHPIFEGRGVRWSDDDEIQGKTFEYGRTNEGGEAEDSWKRSPFYAMEQSGASEHRIRLLPEAEILSGMVARLRDAGHTDHIAYMHRFGAEQGFGGVDCVYSHCVTRQPGGFTEAELEQLRRLVPVLALAVKAAGFARIAHTLAHVYLGRDAGARVLSGRIARGMAEQINAVLWFSDLQGYTAISDAADPSDILPFLNDYAGAAISAILAAGGDVLKLMGDGVLAIFGGANPADAAARALAAEANFRLRLEALNLKRGADGAPTTTAYVGLHNGEVFFGNIGSETRLDFTVVGPAVNEVSRIASMSRSVGRDLLVSEDFLEALPEPDRARFVSVGRFALRGVSRAQSLYTLDPELRQRPGEPSK